MRTAFDTTGGGVENGSGTRTSPFSAAQENLPLGMRRGEFLPADSVEKSGSGVLDVLQAVRQ
jgi:hypothetical protein